MTDQTSSSPQKDSLIPEEIQRITELEALIESLQKEGDILKESVKEGEEKYLRAVADLQNVRRRADEDRIKARLDGGVEVLKGLLQLVDHFSLAFSHLPGDLKDHEWIKGMVAVEKKFYDHLITSGVEFIDETGIPFSEALHESVLLDPEAEAGKVSKILERGVKFKGRVIRPAKVAVGSKENEHFS